MNLEDVLNEKGLQQDEWSLMSKTFGELDQLYVVGHDGNKGNKKHYILKCVICARDRELFGDGYFKSVKNSLVNLGYIPCGCSSHTKWSEYQYSVLCSRKAEQLGYKFLSFKGKWKASGTRLLLLCKEHGEWGTCTIGHLLNCGSGCPKCSGELIGIRSLKPDELMINSFLKTGLYHPDSKFWRSDKTDSMGHYPYWVMSCPECGGQAETTSSRLQLGRRPCNCNSFDQRECYINWIINENGKVIALKFGIANSSYARAIQQDTKSLYSVVQHAVYKFLSADICKAAEKECRKRIPRKFLSKNQMPDGYTETVAINHLIKLHEIFLEFGGMREH